MPGDLSPAAAALKRQSTSELNQSRIVHLSDSDAAKVGASRVRIRGIKARMIEDVGPGSSAGQVRGCHYERARKRVARGDEVV